MRTKLRVGGWIMAFFAVVAGICVASSRQVEAQPHDHVNDRAGQVEQLQRMILPPTAWQMDANLSADRARALSTYPHFGGLHTLTSAEVWVPDNPGVVLVVSRVVATNATEPGLADALLAATREFEMSVAATLDVRTNAVPPSGRNFAHADTATEIRIEVTQATLGYQARLVIARDAQRLEAVTTECIWASNEPAHEPDPAVVACRAALASTNATIVVQKRLPIAMPSAGGIGSASGEAPANGTTRGARLGDAPSTSAPSMSTGPRTTLSDNGKIVFPSMRIAPPATRFNWQPWLVGVGTVIVLLALFLNHRHRQRIEALDGRPIRKSRGGKLTTPATTATTPTTTPTDVAPATTPGADLAASNAVDVSPQGPNHE